MKIKFQELRQHADNLNELQFKTRVLGNEIEDKEKKISDLTKKNKTDEAGKFFEMNKVYTRA